MVVTPKQRKAQRREWYQKNKERAKKNSANYYAAHKVYYLKKFKEHRIKLRKNPLIKQKYKRSTKKWKLALKIRVLQHYSNGLLTCAYCGYSDLRALSIDHVASNGAEHRKQLKNNKRGEGKCLYVWLEKNHFPPGYQVLCMNCQFIKRHTREEWAKKKTPECNTLVSFIDKKEDKHT
jgi:hypothetical protein